MGIRSEYMYLLDDTCRKICQKIEIKEPKVSIIIPVFNAVNYLEKCLSSIVQQTLKEIEIIAVNDGSTDISCSILSCFASYDSRIKIINQENKKQGAARNTGMKIATGEYIGFVDSDDWIDLDYFEKLYNTAKKYDSDIALATNVRIGNGKTKKRLNITEEKLYTSIEDKFNVCNQFNNECPTNKIYRAELLKNNNIVWPEGVYCEDKIFTTKAVYYANAVVSVPNINYYYFRNPTSTVNTKEKKHNRLLLKDKNTAKQSVLKFLREKNATFADKKYWAISRNMPFDWLPIIRIKESVLTKKVYLFLILPVREMPL